MSNVNDLLFLWWATVALFTFLGTYLITYYVFHIEPNKYDLILLILGGLLYTPIALSVLLPLLWYDLFTHVHTLRIY